MKVSKHEIKFRGMDILGNWHYGNFSIIKKDFKHIKKGTYISNNAGMPFAYEVRPETVGQYTGLKDKNGIEIYEGDIVKGVSRSFLEAGYENDIAIISFYKGGFRESYWNENVFEIAERCEIIGNIYENPELLNKANEDIQL